MRGPLKESEKEKEVGVIVIGVIVIEETETREGGRGQEIGKENVIGAKAVGMTDTTAVVNMEIGAGKEIEIEEMTVVIIGLVHQGKGIKSMVGHAEVPGMTDMKDNLGQKNLQKIMENAC